MTVPGAENPLPAPIYMVKLDTDNAVYVGLEDKDVTHPDLPGFNLKVLKDSITFPDGSKEGYLSITQVNSNKVPMPPPNGMQPQLIVTIQPTGAMFDPPAELTLPNVDGHPPGAEVEMYSYDHDLEEFVTIGVGTVSKDGSVLTSNIGTGVIKAGWHCGSPPGGSGCCSSHNGGCDECEDPIGACTGSCVFNGEKERNDQVEGNCKTELCGGTRTDDNDGDGIEDGEELIIGEDGFITNPLLSDSDGDLIDDGLEIALGTDPNDPSDDPLSVALLGIRFSPESLVIPYNTIDTESSQQVAVIGELVDGSDINLTANSTGTAFVSDDLAVASFGLEDGLIFAGQNGVTTVRASNRGFEAALPVTVSAFTPQYVSHCQTVS